MRGEGEFLHWAHCIFQVLEISDKTFTGGKQGKNVRVRAHPDNTVLGLRGIPLASWH